MTNPYAAFNVSDDEDDVKPTVVKAHDKPHRTHQERKQQKKLKEEATKAPAPAPAAQGAIPTKTKEKGYGHMEREKRDRVVKKHFREGGSDKHELDRRSGTGRHEGPRKAGGGYHNVGNTKDEQNAEKYIKEDSKEVTETVEEVPEVEPEPQEPEKPTLDEYYKSKGIDLEYKPEIKEAKKGEIKAEWIKKEKLTLMETKEDKRKNEKAATQKVVVQNEGKAGLNIDEEVEGMVGFGKKASHSHGDDHRNDRKGGRKNKPAFKADDFPTL